MSSLKKNRQSQWVETWVLTFIVFVFVLTNVKHFHAANQRWKKVVALGTKSVCDCGCLCFNNFGFHVYWFNVEMPIEEVPLLSPCAAAAAPMLKCLAGNSNI